MGKEGDFNAETQRRGGGKTGRFLTTDDSDLLDAGRGGEVQLRRQLRSQVRLGNELENNLMGEVSETTVVTA